MLSRDPLIVKRRSLQGMKKTEEGKQRRVIFEGRTVSVLMIFFA